MLRTKYDARAAVPEKIARRRTGFLWSHEVMWDLDIQPQSESWDTWRHRNIYAAAIKSTGAPLDFIAESDDFSRYPFIVAPAYQIVSPDLVNKWQDFVEKGGHLILSCRSGMKNGDGHFFEGKWAAPISVRSRADRSAAGRELFQFPDAHVRQRRFQGTVPCLALDSGFVKIAIETSVRYDLSHWDAAIVSAAGILGAGTLYSEDLNHGQQYGSVRVCNPFRTRWERPGKG
jgi:beta-galactosidase GanA